MTWRNFAADPPPPRASGHIEAVDNDGNVSRPSLFHYSDGRGSLWGHCVEWYATHGRQREVHPDYVSWRYAGPPVPPPEQQGNAILVWQWGKAPGELEAMSTHGGDEDWVALVPASMAEEWIGWMEGGSFGCCSVTEEKLPDGRVVRIGAHA